MRFINTLGLLLALTSSAFAQKSEIKDANDVLEKSILASGGKEVLASVNTLYTEMSTEMEGRKVKCITKEMAPNKGAFQIVYKDRIVFENWFDGRTGYELVNGERKKADLEEFKSIKTFKNDKSYLTLNRSYSFNLPKSVSNLTPLAAAWPPFHA